MSRQTRSSGRLSTHPSPPISTPASKRQRVDEQPTEAPRAASTPNSKAVKTKDTQGATRSTPKKGPSRGKSAAETGLAAEGNNYTAQDVQATPSKRQGRSKAAHAANDHSLQAPFAPSTANKAAQHKKRGIRQQAITPTKQDKASKSSRAPKSTLTATTQSTRPSHTAESKPKEQRQFRPAAVVYTHKRRHSAALDATTPPSDRQTSSREVGRQQKGGSSRAAGAATAPPVGGKRKARTDAHASPDGTAPPDSVNRKRRASMPAGTGLW